MASRGRETNRKVPDCCKWLSMNRGRHQGRWSVEHHHPLFVEHSPFPQSDKEGQLYPLHREKPIPEHPSRQRPENSRLHHKPAQLPRTTQGKQCPNSTSHNRPC